MSGSKPWWREFNGVPEWMQRRQARASAKPATVVVIAITMIVVGLLSGAISGGEFVILVPLGVGLILGVVLTRRSSG